MVSKCYSVIGSTSNFKRKYLKFYVYFVLLIFHFIKSHTNILYSYVLVCEIHVHIKFQPLVCEAAADSIRSLSKSVVAESAVAFRHASSYFITFVQLEVCFLICSAFISPSDIAHSQNLPYLLQYIGECKITLYGKFVGYFTQENLYSSYTSFLYCSWYSSFVNY